MNIPVENFKPEELNDILNFRSTADDLSTLVRAMQDAIKKDKKQFPWSTIFSDYGHIENNSGKNNLGGKPWSSVCAIRELH